VDVFQKILAEKPDNPEALRGLLDAQIGVKDFKAAIVTAEKLVKMFPEDRALAEKQADVHMWAGDFAGAAALYEKLLASDQGNVGLRLKLADALFASGQPAKAVEHYEQVLAARPDDEAVRRKLADACMASKQYAKAVQHFQALYDKHPDDVRLEVDLSRALYLDGRLEDAEKHLRAVLARQPNDVQGVRLLADVLTEQGRFPDAIVMYARAIDLGDGSKETHLSFARVLSWNRDYDKALDEYDKLVQQYPDDWKVAREKARILGWDRQYAKSLRTYQETLDRNPGNEFIKTEMEAKEAYFIGHDGKAVDSYARLVNIEPDNLEARFDLGQVYSRQSMWGDARAAYRDLLEVSRGHYRAREALEKVEVTRDGTGLTFDYTHNWRRSPGRLVDVTRHAWGLGAGKWLSDNVYGSVTSRYETYNFSDYRLVPAEFYQIALRYLQHPWWDAGVSVGQRDFNNFARDRWQYEAFVHTRPFDATDLTLFTRLEDYIQNSQTLRAGTQKKDYGASFDWRATRRLSLGTDYVWSDFNDTNTLNTFRGRAAYRILWEPTRLDIGCRYENSNFKDVSPIYFSPDSFHQQQVYVDWRHYLNKGELFWGTNDTYYDLGLAYCWDVDRENATTGSVGFHHDFSKRLSADLRLLITRGTAYKEDLATLGLTYYFGGPAGVSKK
jgi:tetratricopeptide (TPR) repeat protein